MSGSDRGPADPSEAELHAAVRKSATERLEWHFDDLIESLVGFYRSWFLGLGVELGLVGAVAGAGRAGISAEELASAVKVHPPAADLWLRGAFAHRIVDLVSAADPPRFAMEPALAEILVDEESGYYLGGQFVRSIVSTLDYGELAESFRSGRAVAERAPRYHRAIERVTVQDMTLFIDDGLPRLQAVGRRLEAGIRVLDVACGGGRWLVTMAGRYRKSTFVGVEFEPDSVARARRHVSEAGFEDRIEVISADPAEMTFHEEFGLAYCQDALHELPDPAGALRATWSALRPEATLVVFDWCVPSRLEDYRTALGELVWGVQIDEFYQGTRLMTREEFDALFEAAGLPRPRRIELEAGATLFAASR